MIRRGLLLGIFLSVLAVTIVMGADGKPRKSQVYMFGFAAKMNDSVCVMTELQPVEVYLLPNGFLADRPLYSLQLNNYLVNTEQLDDALTCAVFFNKNKAKAEKRFQKVYKRYRASSEVTLKLLDKDEFKFLPEEWIELENDTESTEKTKSTEKKSEGEKKKGKTKSAK